MYYFYNLHSSSVYFIHVLSGMHFSELTLRNKQVSALKSPLTDIHKIMFNNQYCAMYKQQNGERRYHNN